jgi:intracellular multiplication protein IcmK
MKYDLLKNLAIISCLLLGGNAAFSAQENSAQQALEQLRILQQRIAPNSVGTPPNTNTSANSGNTTKSTRPATLASNPASANNGQSRRGSGDTPEVPSATNPVVVSPPDKDTIADIAFDEMTEQMFPLKPEEIIRIKQLYHSHEYAQASPAGTPPKPTATSQIVNLSPGSTPPVIRLSQGFVSSLVFLDSTGAPWPISAYDLGDPSAFNIQWDKTSNTLMIQAIKLYNYGNLAVRLKGLNTPVMLTLIPGQKAVDYRVDLRIQGLGPNAKSMPLEVGVPPSANDLLLSVLDGVPPPGSNRLIVSGGDARAWLVNERMYVRTSLTILSPGWIGSMTSADGMHAYEMQKSPVLLVSWHGKVMQLKVEGL